jgi:prealbumin domain-containing protein
MRKIAVFISVIALSALMIVYAVPASATVVTDSGFEGADGNLTHESLTDWNDFSDVSWSTGTAPYRSATASPTSGDASGWTFNGFEDAQASTKDTAFNGGVKQDKNCAIIAGSKAPNKDDIKRIYIANKTVQVSGSPHVMLGLAWVRIPQNTTSPSAHVGFEFNENLTGTTCPSSSKGNSDGLVPRTPQGWGGTPAPGHLNGNPSNPGDLLFVYDFEGGSAAPTLTLRHWIASGTCEISSDSAPCWGVATDLTASNIAQALVNTGGSTLDQLAPPVSPATTSVDATLGTKEFGEAIVDLTAAHVFSPGVCTGFGQASGVSRSSGNSGSAAMEDLVGPGAIDISNCASVDVTKTADDQSDQSGVVFTLYSGSDTTGTTIGTCTVISDGTCPNDVTGTTPSFADLQAGTYTIDETTVLTGYDKPASLPYTFTVAAGDSLSLPFENAHQAG